LTQTPGRDNQQIGDVFVDLIDDAFTHYRDFQLSHDWQEYHDGTPESIPRPLYIFRGNCQVYDWLIRQAVPVTGK
jgi:hypothetical protein